MTRFPRCGQEVTESREPANGWRPLLSVHYSCPCGYQSTGWVPNPHHPDNRGSRIGVFTAESPAIECWRPQRR